MGNHCITVCSSSKYEYRTSSAIRKYYGTMLSELLSFFSWDASSTFIAKSKRRERPKEEEEEGGCTVYVYSRVVVGIRQNGRATCRDRVLWDMWMLRAAAAY